MDTAAKSKPAKPAGQEKTPGQTSNSEVRDASTRASKPSRFEQALCALRQQYLGPANGEPGNIGRLVDEISQCEVSTKRAILDAHPTEKRTAFVSGFKGLQEQLCASASVCYEEYFELAVSNPTELNIPPAEFASSSTQACLSTFLKVTAFDVAEEAREINSNGRVRWFVRHACGDYSDLYPGSDGPRAGKRVRFQLPQWFSLPWIGRALVAKRAGYRNGYSAAPATDQLSVEETEEFILEKERALIKEVRDAIADAHRIALVKLGKSAMAITGLAGLTISGRQGLRIHQGRTAKKRLPDRMAMLRRETIRLVPKATRGKLYCKALEGKLSTPISWQQNENCPRNYVDAYWHSDPTERKKWRRRIWDEKYKAHQNT